MNVRDVGELRRLTSRRPSFIPVSGPEIRLEIPGLPYEDRRRWEAQLNNHVGACGCDGGAIALAIVICVSAVSRGVLGIRILRKPAHELVAWMVIGGLSAAAGKALALRRSRRIVSLVEDELQCAYAASVSPVVG
jgi:hypothetical protein